MEATMEIKHVQLLQSTFENERNKEKAVEMEKYMRGMFPFIGLQAQERRQLSSPFMKDLKFKENKDIESIIRSLWEMPEREYQYVAVDYLVRNKKHLTIDHLDLIEYLIVTKSWWDTVDLIASHLVGILFSKYPHLIKERGEEWLHSDHIWLQRTMLLFQLKYKEDTDEELLFSIIKQLNHIDEFFIQKAIGWSLREYSKTKPMVVTDFIERQALSNLAKREGLKYMQRKSASTLSSLFEK